MKKGMKLVCMVLTLAMLLGLLAGCGGKGGDDSNGGGSDQTLLLGLIGPMTGDYAHYGTSTRDGAQVAVEEINAAGGVNGWQLKLQTEDSQGDPDSAISAFGKLMDDKMDVSLGCVLSGEAQSVITAAKNDNVLVVTCTSSAEKCIQGNDKAFRVCFNDPAQGTASANYIADNKLGSKIAVFYQSDIDYSAGLVETFTAQAAQRGLTIVTQQAFTEGTKTDFSTQINAIRDSGCDLVFLRVPDPGSGQAGWHQGLWLRRSGRPADQGLRHDYAGGCYDADPLCRGRSRHQDPDLRGQVHQAPRLRS